MLKAAPGIRSNLVLLRRTHKLDTLIPARTQQYSTYTTNAKWLPHKWLHAAQHRTTALSPRPTLEVLRDVDDVASGGTARHDDGEHPLIIAVNQTTSPAGGFGANKTTGNQRKAGEVDKVRSSGQHKVAAMTTDTVRQSLSAKRHALG